MEELTKIVDIQLRRLQAQLAEAGLTLRITDEAKARLAEEGFDPAYGARPLKRVIQQRLANPLATALLEQNGSPRATPSRSAGTARRGLHLHSRPSDGREGVRPPGDSWYGLAEMGDRIREGEVPSEPLPGAGSDGASPSRGNSRPLLSSIRRLDRSARGRRERETPGADTILSARGISRS